MKTSTRPICRSLSSTLTECKTCRSRSMRPDRLGTGYDLCKLRRRYYRFDRWLACQPFQRYLPGTTGYLRQSCRDAWCNRRLLTACLSGDLLMRAVTQKCECRGRNSSSSISSHSSSPGKLTQLFFPRRLLFLQNILRIR